MNIPEVTSFAMNPEAPLFIPSASIAVTSPTSGYHNTCYIFSSGTHYVPDENDQNTTYVPDENDFWETSAAGYFGHPECIWSPPPAQPYFDPKKPTRRRLTEAEEARLPKYINYTPTCQLSDPFQMAMQRVWQMPEEDLINAAEERNYLAKSGPLKLDQATRESLIKLFAPPPPTTSQTEVAQTVVEEPTGSEPESMEDAVVEATGEVGKERMRLQNLIAEAGLKIASLNIKLAESITFWSEHPLKSGKE
ncbi:hypothetical protein DFH27DRAFT_609672 [Peziza echinospora]|nr:hypothetical protein DFH27DRAFT_609672 [Peziza echinospora]